MTKMPKSGYEFFEHTADIGISAYAPNRTELFMALARGLVALMVEEAPLHPLGSRPIRLSASDETSLLLVWLQELLFWFSTDRFVPVQYALEEVTDTLLRGTVRGETFQPTDQTQGREVKAVTRHQLEVRQEGDLWYGQVIVDI